jgi:hypothetical protein
LKACQATHALVVDENLGHLANRRTALFEESHPLGFAIDLDFFKRQGLGFEHHLGGIALGACGLGVDNDFEFHALNSSESQKPKYLHAILGKTTH